MGTLAQVVRARSIGRFGRRNWEDGVVAINLLWDHIRSETARLDLPYPRVRLYQDGLPVCGNELDIARELARSGSPNHQLLLSLVEKGATLMGTESPELLVEEYRLAQRALLTGAPPESPEQKMGLQALSHDLLQRRDRFIASRISETLGEGETALLLLGMLHSLRGLLPSDIHVSFLILPPGLEGSGPLR